MIDIFSGSSVAIVTPMLENEEIDYNALSTLLQWHIDSGTDSIVIAGTTGESPTLSVEEHRTIIAKTVELVGGRIPVIAGVGGNSTTEAIILTKHAYNDGATAGLSVVPYYNKPTQEGLYQHFTQIAQSSPLPIILYDVPGRTITELSDETIVRLAENPNIVGIKDATGDITRVSRLHTLLGDKSSTFVQLSGDDKTFKDYILQGGHGVISVTANIAPAQMKKVVDAARQNNQIIADKENNPLKEFHEIQGIESNPIPVKAALHLLGKISPSIRLPLTPLSTKYHSALKNAIEKIY